MVTVTTASGSQQHVNGTGWVISDTGYLTVTDDSGGDVASYAPGWQSAAADGALAAVTAPS